MVLCNSCGAKIIFVQTKEGDIKCDLELVKGVTETGRIVFVRLLHECVNGSDSQDAQGKKENKEFWISPPVSERR